ncbi:CHAD domain-containing protein [Chelativorans xinjiangense]|uniref:CHAD domain-containing protein n=1 Tax=Chelativorans xinjiangense TaxID=2681485 RepID=UPI00135C644A|nr:CHAD domain-containing protein [Chelativorans xinjiangense]
MSYCFDPALPVDVEVRRIAGDEIATIAALLREAPEGRQHSLHGARKRLKRLRGLIKLVREGDEDFHARENRRFRDMARSLSAARDADALVETLDRFTTGPGARAAAELAVIRTYLENRRDRIVREHAERDAVPAALASLAEAQAALEALALPRTRQEGARLLARGARAMVATARRALKMAKKGGGAEDFHELRKALKYHWMHLSLLGHMWPGRTPAHRRRADRLAEKLGELNDICAMYHMLDQEEAEIAAPDAVSTFRKLLATREKTLRKACLSQAAALLEGEGKKLRSKIEREMRKAA